MPDLADCHHSLNPESFAINFSAVMATPRVDYVQKAQEYELPKCVKLGLDADIQQANAAAIVMALFAGALVSLAQLVGSSDLSDNTNAASWGAMLVLLYSAIMLNLGGAFLSLIAVKMCSDLPLAAQQKLLREGSSTSKSPISMFARGKTLPSELLENHFGLLESFGMSEGYELVDKLCVWVLMAACVFTFASVTYWVFLSENIITAGITMIIFGPIAIAVIRVSYLAGLGQGWK